MLNADLIYQKKKTMENAVLTCSIFMTSFPLSFSNNHLFNAHLANQKTFHINDHKILANLIGKQRSKIFYQKNGRRLMFLLHFYFLFHVPHPNIQKVYQNLDVTMVVFS